MNLLMHSSKLTEDTKDPCSSKASPRTVGTCEVKGTPLPWNAQKGHVQQGNLQTSPDSMVAVSMAFRGV